MNQRGVTFIELILYISLMVIVLTALIPFSWNIIEGGVKSGMKQEAYDNARFIAERITAEIRDAVGINSVSATSISLVNSDAVKNPTVITISSGNVLLTQGASPSAQLNSTMVTMSSFVFTNYTSADNTTKNIQFTFTAQLSVPTARKEYKETVTVRSDAELRSN